MTVLSIDLLCFELSLMRYFRLPLILPRTDPSKNCQRHSCCRLALFAELPEMS